MNIATANQEVKTILMFCVRLNDVKDVSVTREPKVGLSPDKLPITRPDAVRYFIIVSWHFTGFIGHYHHFLTEGV